MSGAQLGKTSILENFIGYIIDLDPGPLLLVQPREADCEAFSKDRLAPMLRDCGTLRGKIADARSRDSNNTILHKKFTGGSITMSAASSPAGLAMRSIRYCLLDEVDRYPASAGSEGDPVNLAVTRTANFWNRKIVLCSTPTVKGTSRIEAAWLESNQQMYWVPCPHCGTHQVLRWPNVEWPEGEPEKAQYRCEYCGQMIGEHQKAWMLKHGEWRAARPDRGVTGFWINSLYSPWRKWRDLARKFLVDQKSPETLREFVNTVLAEPWDDEAQTSVDLSELLARREHYRAPVPAGAAVLTCGVDVQADRLELELVGWGRGEESWSIEYRVIPGDPDRRGGVGRTGRIPPASVASRERHSADRDGLLHRQRLRIAGSLRLLPYPLSPPRLRREGPRRAAARVAQEADGQEHPRRTPLDGRHRLGQGNHHGPPPECPGRHARKFPLPRRPPAAIL